MHPAHERTFAMSYKRTPVITPFFCRVLLCWLLICILATPAYGVMAPTWRNTNRNDSQGVVRRYTLGRGDTLLKVLQRSGVARADAYEVIYAMQRKRMRPSRLLIGTQLEMHFSRETPDAEPVLSELSVSVVNRKNIDVLRSSGGTYTSRRVKKSLRQPAVASASASADESEFEPVAGPAVASAGAQDSPKAQQSRFQQQLIAESRVRHSTLILGSDLELQALKKGVALPIVQRAEELMQKKINLRNEVESGDTLALVWEENGDNLEDEDKVADGLLACALDTGDQTIEIFRFTDHSGLPMYFDASGKCISKPMDMPIPHARITSPYGIRKHPVLHAWRMHMGVDFKGATGTPVHAAADGVVVAKKWAGGYGRLLTLKHSEELTTRYAHLSKFAKLRVGQKVSKGDVIGYVGSTGRVTGPHLHFEVVQNGNRVNPMNFDLREDVHMTVAELESFATTRQHLETQLALTDVPVGNSKNLRMLAAWKISD